MSRELDATIAEALGYSLAESASEPVMDRSKSEFMSQLERVPYYSTDGNAMLELDREMRERGWAYKIKSGIDAYSQTDEWITMATCRNEKREYFWSFATTEPLARALAAYKALTGKEWEGE